jgi:hypothetical protein
MGNPPPLHGSSSTTEGILRGRAQGNVFNVADAEKGLEAGLGTPIGKVKIYRPGEDPSSLKPQMVLKSEVTQTMGPLLTELGELYSPVKSESFILFPCKSYNFAEKNYRIFVYEEGNWSLKGRYKMAIKFNDSVAWSNDRGDYSLAIALVGICYSYWHD